MRFRNNNFARVYNVRCEYCFKYYNADLSPSLFYCSGKCKVLHQMAVIKKNPYRQDTPKIKEHLEQRAINSFKRRMSKMMKFKCHNLGWGHWGSFGK